MAFVCGIVQMSCLRLSEMLLVSSQIMPNNSESARSKAKQIKQSQERRHSQKGKL